MPLDDRMQNRRPLGGRRPPPAAAPPPPVVPPPTNPVQNRPGARRPGGPARNPAAPGPSAPPPGGAVRPGQRLPNPAADPLPPAFAKMVANGMPEAQARQRWGRSLQNRGKVPGAAPAPPPTAPGAPPAAGGPPTPFTPVAGAPVGSPGMPPMPGLPDVTGGSPIGGGQGGLDFRDPMQQFLAAVPIMNANATRQIGDAMASAGFSGNRWGTSSQNIAGQIGAENAMKQNSLMANLLADSANRQEDRALQATGMSMGLGQMLDQQAQDRVRLPFELGQYEQGRQDDFAKMRYGDFENNKLGWLPFMADLAKSQGAGSPGQVYTTQTPGKPGAADWLQVVGPLLGMLG